MRQYQYAQCQLLCVRLTVILRPATVVQLQVSENSSSIECKFFITKGLSITGYEDNDSLLECSLYLDDTEVPNTKEMVHLNLIEKYVTIKGIINTSSTTWTSARTIKLKVKSLYDENDNIKMSMTKVDQDFLIQDIPESAKGPNV